MELEPLYQHAFRLLHSRREDAAEKLKKKLFEAMGRRYEAPKDIIKIEGGNMPGSGFDAAPLDNAEKLDVKLGQSKQSRRSSDTDTETRSRSSGAEEVVIDEFAVAETKATNLAEMGISDIDADEIAIGMGIACVVCRLFEVSSNNKLVECQECHSLYHQLCHKPAVTEQEVNDPRSVWYCARCSKTLRKLEKNPMKPTKSQASVKESSSSGKSDSSNGKQEAAFFRRLDSSKGNAHKEGSGSSTSSKPYSGLAGLAANLSGKATEKSSSSLKDDKTTKDGKKPLLAEAAVDRPAKVKLPAPGDSEVAHDKAPRKFKDKSSRPERRDTDGGVGISKDDSHAPASSALAPRSPPLRRESAVAERSDAGSIDDRKAAKLKAAVPAADTGTKTGAATSVDKVAKSGGQVMHKDKDDGLHKHKVKKPRKD